MCAFEEEINLKKKTQKNALFSLFFFCMDIDFVVPSIEGDRIIPLYTNSLTLQRQSPKWHFCHFWQILIKETSWKHATLRDVLSLRSGIYGNVALHRINGLAFKGLKQFIMTSFNLIHLGSLEKSGKYDCWNYHRGE